MLIKTVSLNAPTAEPVSLADVKIYLGIEADADRDDEILKDAISQCRAAAEHYCGRTIANRDLKTTIFLDEPDPNGYWMAMSIRAPLVGPVIRIISVIGYIGEKSTTLTYRQWGNSVVFFPPHECTRVEVGYISGSMENLGAEVIGAIKEMVRVTYRREGGELLTEEIKRALGRRENI